MDNTGSRAESGRLSVVGTGISFAAHLTPEAKSFIEQADEVFFGVVDDASAAWIAELNPRAQSLPGHRAREPRIRTYAFWKERVMSALDTGAHVCVALYGHPGVGVGTAHELIAVARAHGYPARMIPGISCDDCLYADLGIDPATSGLASFDATDFIVNRRVFDPRGVLLLRQPALLGEVAYGDVANRSHAWAALVAVLSDHYPSDHDAILYEAARLAVHDPRVRRIPLGELTGAEVSEITTLVLPPIGARTVIADSI